LHILISNDDGYLARGLRVLADALAEFATVTVVAPDRNRSGASNSLTLDSPLRVEQVSENVYFVNGTPTDCVHVAPTSVTMSCTPAPLPLRWRAGFSVCRRSPCRWCSTTLTTSLPRRR
jgi:5'/3'-nucleotidase SurE